MSQNKNTDPAATTALQRVGTVAALASLATLAYATPSEHHDRGSSPTHVSELLTNTADVTEPGIINVAADSQYPLIPDLSFKPKPVITITLPHAQRPVSHASHQPKTEALSSKNITSPKSEKTTRSATKEVSLHPESWTIPDAAASIMSRDVTYISGLGCSGFLVRNQADEAIGVLTAEHCGLRGSGSNSHLRQLGSDGQSYVVIGNPLEAQVGLEQSQLTVAGVIQEFFVPPADDTDTDVALGAFAGHSSEEVVAAYNANKLSELELAKLKLGDRMYLSGWPSYQPGDAGNFERQDFSLAVLGRETTATSAGETLDVVWAAVPTDKDGAVCSFGDSGGEGFVMQAGQPRAVGVLSAFVDFTGQVWGSEMQGATERKNFEDTYNVDLSGVAAVCGFAYKTPDANQGGTVIKPVIANSEIPGYNEAHSPEAEIQKARQSFLDPTYKRTIVDGVINVSDISSGHLVYGWKYRPVIFYDTETFSAVIGSYNPKAPDSLELDYIPSLSAVNVFTYGIAGSAPIITSDGIVRLNPEANNNAGSFVDRNGLSFGQTLTDSFSPNFDNWSNLYYDAATGILKTYNK